MRSSTLMRSRSLTRTEQRAGRIDSFVRPSHLRPHSLLNGDPLQPFVLSWLSSRKPRTDKYSPICTATSVNALHRRLLRIFCLSRQPPISPQLWCGSRTLGNTGSRTAPYVPPVLQPSTHFPLAVHHPAHLTARYPALARLQAKVSSVSTAPMRTSCAPRDELSIQSA